MTISLQNSTLSRRDVLTADATLATTLVLPGMASSATTTKSKKGP